MIKKVNNKKRTMKERTEKGSVNKMLNTFNNKIDDLEFSDFDESIDIDEARDSHTWGITYRDKSKRAKQHMVGASDAYDAKMKARKELGINFSDIDDIELIENEEINENLIIEDISSSQASKVYSELKRIFDDFSDNMIETVEADYDSYKEMGDEDISFEEWFRETKTNYPDYFKYIFAIMFEDYLDGGY